MLRRLVSSPVALCSHSPPILRETEQYIPLSNSLLCPLKLGGFIYLAVEVLEREGKMRCVSVHGYLDIVGMLPSSALNRATKRRFCQSGFELVLMSKANEFYMRRSERADDDYLQRLGLALLRADKIAERHGYLTYIRELEALMRALDKLHLNDFYDKIVERGLFPCSEKRMAPMEVVRVTRGRSNMAMLEEPSINTTKANKKEMTKARSDTGLDL